MYEMFKVEDMPGPSDEAKALQRQQLIACEAMYDALNEVRAESPGISYEDAYTHPKYLEKKAAYEGTVTALQTLLGDQAHCNYVDSNLWSTFSDCFKSDNGIRPRGMHYTRDAVLEYFQKT